MDGYDFVIPILLARLAFQAMVLEATYILVRLEPYFENFGKRLIKSSKIYFVDTGLLCYLLGIRSKEQLVKDPLYGNFFENWVIMELMKARYNQALDPLFISIEMLQEEKLIYYCNKGAVYFQLRSKVVKRFLNPETCQELMFD